MKAYQCLWIFSVCYNYQAIAAADVSTEKEQPCLYSTLLYPTDGGIAPENESFYTISSLLDNENECRNQLTSYVYSKNLCGVTDLQSFIESSTEEYTCADRCGREPTFGKNRECACDDKCGIYGDCCRDFPSVCSELHGQASVIYSHLKQMSPICKETSMVLVNFLRFLTENKITEQAVATVPASSSMTTVITTQLFTNFSSVVDDFLSESLDEWWHKNFKWPLMSFQIIDMTFGFTFSNLDSFESRKIKQSNPYLLPKIGSLYCSEETGSSAEPMRINNKKAAYVFPYCRVLQVRDMESSFRRNCYNRDLHRVTCKCGVSNGLSSQYLYDACLGEHSDVPLYSSNAIEGDATTPEYDKEYDIANCFYKKNVVDVNDEESDDLGSEVSMKIIFLPMFPSSDQMKGTHSNTRIFQESLDGGIGDRRSIEYVIVFTQILERRVRCPNFFTFLFDCHLEECAKGALLWINPPSQTGWKFKSNKCFLPVLALVQATSSLSRVPICTCLQVVIAVQALKVWDIKVDRTRPHVCSFRLQAKLDEENISPEELMFSGPTKNHSFPSTIDALRKRLQNHLNTKVTMCPHGNIYRLDVCLYEREKHLALQLTEKAMCFKLLVGQPKDFFNSCRSHFSMSKTSLILMIILNLSALMHQNKHYGR